MPLVAELRGITKRYGSQVALDGIDLQVEAGQAVGLLGPNGAGKTTAVKVLLGLARPSGGAGTLLGRPFGDPAARREVGYLPELFRFQGWLTGREVLRLHLELAGIPHLRWAGEEATALELSDLAARADDRVATYSKGMQQRLGLATALLGSPRFVVLDEPGTALDPIGRHQLRAIIRGLVERGTAVLLNSHQLGEVEHVCDRVAIMHRGRMHAFGALADLLGTGGLRIRATGVDAATRQRLAGFGPLHDDGAWLEIEGVADEATPRIVAALADSPARVYEVQRVHPSLEERFMQLLEDPGR